MRVETRASYAADLLNSTLTARLSEADRGLAQELTMGCLRWQGQLDFLIAHFAGKPVKLDPEVRVALRLGIFQIRHLERIPAHAAVDQSVELVKRSGKAAAAGLVNAVLRKVHKRAVQMPETAEYSTPQWLLDRWGKEIAALNNQRPATFVRLPPGEAGSGRWVRRCGIGPRPGLPIQDEASQMIAYLLDARDGDWVLDLCAAPGNKSAQLAELAPGARIVAADLYPARLARVTPAMRVALDGAAPLPLARRFDRILLDAPCSGTGTVRRNPEIKWRLTPADLADLAARQRALLTNALEYLAPGGRLVYSTCSLEPEENEQVVESVRARVLPASAERGRLRDDFTEEGLALLGDPYFRTAPSPHGADGFFAAILEAPTSGSATG
jgi:16S rRNA (cytosine967-C5)-methyltransferase